MEKILEDIKKNVVEGRVDSQDEGFEEDMVGKPGATELVEQALEKGISPGEILTKGLNPGMEEVGRLFEEGTYMIPDMLAAAECVGEAMNILEPHLLSQDIERKGTFVIATVKGDLHDIGKNIVTTLLKGSGYEVIDLGTGVPEEKIVTALKDNDAKYLGLSALLTTTMGHMEEVIDALEKAGLRDKVIVFVGGAPVTEDFAKKIGADHYCKDAFDAINKLKSA